MFTNVKKWAMAEWVSKLGKRHAKLMINNNQKSGNMRAARLTANSKMDFSVSSLCAIRKPEIAKKMDMPNWPTVLFMSKYVFGPSGSRWQANTHKILSALAPSRVFHCRLTAVLFNKMIFSKV